MLYTSACDDESVQMLLVSPLMVFSGLYVYSYFKKGQIYLE